jgi:hypothetical protein
MHTARSVFVVKLSDIEFEKYISVEVMQGLVNLLVLGREKCL